MDSVVFDIATNVAANIVFWLGLGLLASTWVRLTQRRFRQFFGLAEVPRLVVCLSNTWSKKLGSRERGYMLALHELRASEEIARLFAATSFRMPDAVRGLVDTLFLNERYNHSTVVSPAETDGVAEFKALGDNLIVIGGASKNRIRRMYLQNSAVVVRMSNERDPAGPVQLPKEEWAVDILVGPAAGNTIKSQALELFVVEKIRDTERGVTVFFCIGRKGDTTWAAAAYLARHWRALHKEFGQRDFALCLGIPDPEYGYNYCNPSRLWSSAETR